ncbi:MAG TPA: 4-hydroxythreonine-4-phosphate dehydrogenase PdxA, partial [Achromobacter sp.]|nr:4-hydroxythreonine-4-phosphate dehydrogenase PdxA [Achromobacter sp.]
MNPSLPVGITMGDAAGIGPEIVVKAIAQGLSAPCVVYGDSGALRRAVAQLGARLDVVEVRDVSQAGPDAARIHVIACSPALPDDLPLGQISAAAGRGAYDYVCAAIDDAQAGRIRAIVTAPLNKKSMHEAGIDYPGHTEILADRSATQDFAMMLANDELRVLLVTIHVALAE